MTAKDDSVGLASPNFGHLATVVPQLALLGARAERYVFEDPSVALVELRQLGEVLAQETAARTGLYVSPTEAQADLLRRLRDERIIDFEVANLFHALRKAGSRATHDGVGTQRDALHGLRMAYRLAIWFQCAFVDRAFQSGPFVPPPDRLRDAVLAEYAARCPGLGIIHLTAKLLRTWPVPVAPLEEQKMLIGILPTLMNAISSEAARHAQLQQQVVSLDQSILSKAFRGELVPQDPTDEPASALLDRIRAARESTTDPKRPGKRPRKPKPAQ